MRIISKIEIKNNFAVKGIGFEGIRKIGDPEDIAIKYYNEGVDEIIFSDVVASLYERNQLYNLVKKFSKNIFVPMTLGGGLKTEKDIHKALKSGADKVFFNSAILKEPKLIKFFSDIFGSQCIVVSIEAKKINDEYFCYYNSGRENSGKKISDWIKICEDFGCGEFIITSIDNDGSGNGFDHDLVHRSLSTASRPVVISGGVSKLDHIEKLIKDFLPSGICLSSSLHYNLLKITDVRDILKKNNIMYVR
jgi:imidazole glycerol-phosphate synthase subunit HisF